MEKKKRRENNANKKKWKIIFEKQSMCGAIDISVYLSCAIIIRIVSRVSVSAHNEKWTRENYPEKIFLAHFLSFQVKQK